MFDLGFESDMTGEEAVYTSNLEAKLQSIREFLESMPGLNNTFTAIKTSGFVDSKVLIKLNEQYLRM